MNAYENLTSILIPYTSRRKKECSEEASVRELSKWLNGPLHVEPKEFMSPLLTRLIVSIKSGWSPEDLSKLTPLLPLLVETVDDELDSTRSFLLFDWVVRVYIPTLLTLTSFKKEAHALQSLSTLESTESILAAESGLSEIVERVSSSASINSASTLEAASRLRYAVGADRIFKVRLRDINSESSTQKFLREHLSDLAAKIVLGASSIAARGLSAAGDRTTLNSTALSLQESFLDLIKSLTAPLERDLV